MIKTFIFDLGNVIVRFDHSRIFKRIEQFCDLKSAEIQPIIFASTVVHDYDLGRISSPEFFEQATKLLSLRMTFIEFSDAWNSTFEAESILPDELIERLAEKYRLLILSDTNQLHFEFIKNNFPILRHFDDYVLSYETGSLKPQAEIYRTAVEKANCLPEECFFIDDREGNIFGARAVGINALLFDGSDTLVKDLKRLELL
jgi:glucose-1-phosphatase